MKKNYIINIIITLVAFTSLNASSEDYNYLYPFKTVDYEKYGYINKTGRTIIYPDFDQAFNFKDGIAIYRKANLYGFINSQGNIIEPLFTDIRGVGENIVTAKKENKWSYYDFNGNQLINRTFDDAYPFNNGLARVFYNNRYGYIDKEGKQIIKAVYDYADNFYDSYAYATFANKDNTVINKTGKVVISTEKDHIYNFYEGIAVYAGENNRYGYVTKSLKKTKPIYQFADNFKNGLARIKINNKWGFINKDYQYAIKPIYDEIRNFSYDLALFRKNNKWGFVDLSGKEINSNYFDSALSFSEGLAAVKKDNLWGYINRYGDYAIKPKFDNAESFIYGLANVDNVGYIDQSGTFVWSQGQFADNDGYKSIMDTVKYNLDLGTNVCVNQWNNTGFCGQITSKIDNKYIIKVKSLNCPPTGCNGGCSDNLLEVSKNNRSLKNLIDKEQVSVEVYKDCITSY